MAKTKMVDPMIVSAKKAQVDNKVMDRKHTINLDEDEDVRVNYDGMDDIEEIDSILDSEEIDEIPEKPVSRTRKSTDTSDCPTKISKKEFKDLPRKERKERIKNARLDAAYDDNGKLKKGYKKNGKRKMKVWKKVLICLLIILLGVGGYAAWYALTVLGKTTKIFSGNITDIFTPVRLATDEHGLTNLLVFGTSEDEEGHGGALLTDSILVVSLNQDKKIAKTFSIPRDLWVNYSLDGEDPMSCWTGYRGKINATYMCALNANDQNTDKAARYFARKVSEITGVDIHYYIAIDWTVVVTTVDALGGVDVDIHAVGDNGISDVCQQLRITNDQLKNYHADGKTALKIARARGACYAYGGEEIQVNFGLPNSNFDREINQQRIINAMKDKALNIGILADPTKVITIIDSLGENVKTNITMSELRSGLDIALGMKGEIESIETQKLFSTGNINGQSSVIPKGAALDSNSPSVYNYTYMQSYFEEELESLYLDKKEVVVEGETEDDK
ncbi:MAG: LCP family protein [Candidatus Saccharibacteria bacterium]|nr:LCP family protein [Candidatus Saccharibacteria bacterium]